MSQVKKQSRRGWLFGLGGVLIVGVAAVAFVPGLLPALGLSSVAGAAEAQAPTGTISTVDAISSIETSGAVEARQTALVVWDATGQVAVVNARLGDFVQAGDILMTLEAADASANIPQAESELLDAQNALDDLLNPSTADLAAAEQAVLDAQAALKTAQRNLRYATSPDVSYYADQLAVAQRAYDSAAADLEMTTVGSGSELASLERAQTTAADAYSDWQHKIIWYGEYHGDTEDAKEQYDQALEDLQVAQLVYDNTLASRQAALATAQDTLEDAQANLAAAQAGPNAEDVAEYEAAVNIAQANLDAAQETRDELVNGADPDEIQKAELRVAATQANLDEAKAGVQDAQYLTAPIAGEVLDINFQPGDTVSPSETAVLLADRQQLHIEAQVDESGISQVTPGDPVSIRFEAVPGLVLSGTVGHIYPVGQTVQGLVKYTVRIDTTSVDPRVLLGMTASLSIVTDIQAGALVAPLEAVRLDDQGEYVMRVNALGAAERVSVVSGAVLAAAMAGTATDVVLVRGDLHAGDTVQLVAAVPASTGGGLFQ